MDRSLAEIALDCLRRGRRVVLAVVVEIEGGSPGRPGFKMLVTAEGRAAGTIGGGEVEHRLIDAACRMAASGEPRPAVVSLRHHDDRAAGSSGMICGGSQTTLLYPCRPEDAAAFEQAASLAARGGRGTLRLSPNCLEVAGAEGRGDAAGGAAFFPPRFHRDAAGWRYEECLGLWDTAYLVGGGHVSLALSRLLVELGFRLVVFDDRPTVDTLAANTFAHEKIVLPYAEVGRHIPDGLHSFVAIMTEGHRADALVLGQLVGRELRYLGMMGSTNKVAEIFGQLRQKGVERAALTRVRAPIGLPIHSRTPTEIAVSIAAELVQVRNAPEHAGRP